MRCRSRKGMKKVFSMMLALLLCISAAGLGEGAEIAILKETDERMLNSYTLVAVNPDAPFTDADGKRVEGVYVNTAGADALIRFLLSVEALAMAGEYGIEVYGQPLFYVQDEAPEYGGEIAPADEETRLIRMSTTTSVNDSGLLGRLLPAFEQEYGYRVEVQSLGTGKAIASAKYGNADLILVHDRVQEEAFVDGGFGRIVDGFEAERVNFVYNYFVLCGPEEDPAGVAGCESVEEAFAIIAEAEHCFISRGDNSGTHARELLLWPEELGITMEGGSFRNYTWYVSANAGMGACLVMAREMNGYILTDKGTYLRFASENGWM